MVSYFNLCKLLFAYLQSLWVEGGHLQLQNEVSSIAPGTRQSKTLSTIDEHGSKIDIISVFDCHMSPVLRQMAIENSVSNYSDLSSSIVLTFSIAAYPV